jgi:hypothetical protein
MAKDPAFLFYPGDYLRDTQTLSEKTQVAYDRIMCEHMRNICISKQQLKFFTKKLSPEELEELMFVLTEVKDGFQIEWVSDSINKRKAYSESRRKNRSKKNKQNSDNISKTYVEHMEIENEIENEDINKDEIELNETQQKTIQFICDKFGISEMKQFQNYRIVYSCVVCQFNQGEELFKHFKDQCWNYFMYKNLSQEKIHSFKSFIGTPEDKYNDGGWNANNWIKKHTDLNNKEKGIESKVDKDWNRNKRKNEQPLADINIKKID